MILYSLQNSADSVAPSVLKKKKSRGVINDRVWLQPGHMINKTQSPTKSTFADLVPLRRFDFLVFASFPSVFQSSRQ